MVYYSALHWAKKAEKSAEKCEQIKEDLRDSGLDLSDYAKKGEVVHNTGDETIDGVKTFNNGVFFNSAVDFVKNTTNTVATYQDVNYIRDKSLETNNIPYNKTYYTNALMDKNNKYVTYIQNVHKADGASSISISARTQNANGENVTSSIGVEATKNGDVVATAPIPTASSSMDSKQISTVGWVNDPTKSTNVVHRSGDETIDGIKTFNNTVLSYNPLNAFNSLNKNITRGTAPTSGQNGFLTRISDKYNTNLAGLYYTHTIKNENSLSMLVYDPTKSSGYDQAFLRLGYGGSGAWSETVKPANNGSQSSANIATVGWVNDPSASLNVVHRSGDETIRGDKTYVGNVNFDNSTYTGVETGFIYQTTVGQLAVGVRDKTGLWKNGIRIYPNGKIDMMTPPTSDSNSNEVTTTAWVVKYQPAITNLSATSGNISLSINNIYTMSVSGTTTFSLATPSNKSVFNQIKLMMKVTGTPTINWGTTYFFNKIEPRIEAGSYDVYFDYDNLLSAWVCGVIPKGTKEY